MASSSPKSGFTLLEILVALAILSVTLGALYQTFSASLSYQTTAAREAQGISIAQSLLARVGADMPAKAGEFSGDAGDGFAWQLTITPVDVPAGAPVMPVEVKVSVAWQTGAAAHSIMLHSTRLVARAVVP
jgi:general secretion pathway protein I